MDWHVVEGDPEDADSDRVEWERSDRYARVALRETATGSWAVTLDRLSQAPEGQYYHRETLPDRERALEQAAAWREENDGTGTSDEQAPEDA
jgi:hypothetical protein